MVVPKKILLRVSFDKIWLDLTAKHFQTPCLEQKTSHYHGSSLILPEYWFHGVFLRKFKMDISSKFLQRIEDQLLIVTTTVKFTPQKFNIDTRNDALENVYIYTYIFI